ncbi:MAG TPA: RAMP superfamily CRISPR-associated protein, partial [Calditrichia bacterium]|nr:RAMP superfamily CRISPR-associated protein [Calditrichia bacterium]
MSKWQKGTLKQIQNGLFLHYGDSEETQFPIKSKQIKKGFPAVVAELGGKAEMVVYFRAEGELLKELVTKAPEGFSEPVAQETPPPQPETESIAPVISEVELFTPDEIGVGEELLNFSPPPVNLAKSRGNGEEGGFSPYNFVSLPPGPVLTRLQSDRPTYSGRLEAKMVNKEPMFIRDGRLGEEGAEVFFNLGNPDQPAIPSTSLKGVLRSVLEAVCGSGYERVEDRYFFLRDIRSRQYTSMFIDAPNSEYLMQAGFLRKVDGRYYLQPAQWGKVSINDLHRNLTGKGAGVPPYNIRTSRIDEFMAKSPQGKRVRANFKAYYNMEIGFSASVSQSMQVPNSPFRLNYNQIQGIGYSGSKKGRLVLTGPMNHKSNEFVFYDAEPNIARWIPVQRSVIDTFARDTSDFQEEMFGTGLNIDNNGVPLFWLPADRRKESVYFFGRPTMFRIPYPYKLKAYVPKRFKGDAGQTFESLCLADKLLGTLDINADKDAKRGSIGLRGRVQVSPGTYQGRRDKPQDPKSLVKKKPEFLWDSP